MSRATELSRATASRWRTLTPFAFMLLLGILDGLAFDRLPAAPAEKRGGKYLMQVDLHTHTRLSDGFLSPPEVVLAARRRGLDAVAVTEHNGIFAARIAQWFSRSLSAPQVIVGEEVTSSDAHLIALGLVDTVEPRRDLGAVIDAVHAQHGIVIAAHPTKRYWEVLMPQLAKLDGLEVVSPLAYAKDNRVVHYSEMPAFYNKALKAGYAPAAIGSSDFHFFGLMGAVRTFVLADGPGAEHVIAAIRAGDTATIAPDGRRFGNARLLAMLAKKSPRREPAHPYQNRGWLDALLRCIGWLGIVGLLTLRWRRDESA